MKLKLIIFIAFLICFQNIYAQEEVGRSDYTPTNDDTKADDKTSNDNKNNSKGIKITNFDIEYFTNADFNRTYQFVGSSSLAFKLTFNDKVAVKEGISFSWTDNVKETNLFTNAGYRILTKFPLEAKLAWVYNGLPDYDTHVHSLAPLVSWNAKYYGISVGYGFRFTSFFGEGVLVEHLLPLGIYVNFINNENICVGMSLANFDDYRIDSFIAFALAAKVSIFLGKGFSITNELEFRQSGVDGLSATFHGIVWKGGIKLSW